ncbi:helix-turn-helix domain-containing protein [Streptomyces sp. NPDC054796]
MEPQPGGFGAELRRRRQAGGHSLNYLAGLVHCSRSYLSRIETGQRRVTYELAELCDIALDAQGELLALAPPPRTPSPPRRAGSGTGTGTGAGVRGPRMWEPSRVPGAHAADGGSGHGAEFDRLVRRGDVHYMAGRMAEADDSYRWAHRLGAGSPRAQAVAVTRQARHWSDPGQVDRELLHLLRGALAALRDDEGAEAAGLRLRLGAHLAKKLSLAVSRDTALPEAGPRHGADLAHRVLTALDAGDHGDEVRCEVLTECRWGLYDYEPPSELLRLSQQLLEAAVRLGDPYFRGEALVALAIDQLRVGRVHSAWSTVDLHRKHAARSGSALARWQQCTLDTLFDLWGGKFESAADWIFGESREVVGALEADLAVPADTLQQTRLGQAYWLLREEGRMDELFSSGLAENVERHGFFPVWRAGMALALCETGDLGPAADRLVAFADDTEGFTALPPYGWALPAMALLAEVCAALDAHGGYGDALARVLPGLRRAMGRQPEGIALAGWPTVLIGPTARALGLLDLAAGDTSGALRRFREAERPAGDSPPQMARLRLAQARALMRSAPKGRGRAAAGLLGTALSAAERYGMKALARECRVQLERAPG